MYPTIILKIYLTKNVAKSTIFKTDFTEIRASIRYKTCLPIFKWHLRSCDPISGLADIILCWFWNLDKIV